MTAAFNFTIQSCCKLNVGYKHSNTVDQKLSSELFGMTYLVVNIVRLTLAVGYPIKSCPLNIRAAI